MTLTPKQYYGIKNGLTTAEKDLIAYFELRWQLRGEVPTVDEVVIHLRKKPGHERISHTSVNYYLGRQPVKNALKRRGIPFENHTQDGLTNEQIAAATVACNFADERTLHAKLDDLGIKSATYQAWLLDPQFKHLVDTISERNLKNIRPVAVTEFTRLIATGYWPALKHYFEVTAAEQANSAPETEQLLRAILEILQTHIKDVSLLDAIGRDILKAAQNRPQEITGYIVQDEEVLDASKKLGIR